MSGYYDMTSGVCQVVQIKCATGKSCLLERALSLHRKYISALFALEDCNRKYGQRLQMAYFVRKVVKEAAKSKEINDDVWANLRTSSKGGEASSYDDTWLKKDIEKMEATIKKLSEQAEDRAEKLAKFIKASAFQKHLLKYHTRPLSDDDLKAFYGIETGQPKDKAHPPIREIDHYAAVLTDNLAVTKAGVKLLEDIGDPDNWQSHVAFADVWGNFGKFYSASEAAGKFIYNWSPIISLKITELVKKGTAKTYKDILGDASVKKPLKFLGDRFKFDAVKWIDNKAKIYERGAEKAAQQIQYRNDWKQASRDWMKEGHKDFDAKYKAAIEANEHHLVLDNLWIGITFDGVAFALSAIKIASDLKNAKWNDYLGAANDLIGLSKTLLDGRASQLALRGQSYAAQARHAAKAVKALGVIGGLIGAFLSAYDAYKGLERGDWEVFAIHAAGVGLAVGGTIAVIMELSVLSGVLAILGFILAVLAAIILDPKIIDYIEDLEWGEYKNIAVKDTILEYYKQLFDIKVSFVVDSYDANNSHILIESGLLSDTSPVFVELVREKDNKSLGKFRVYPGRKTVLGRGQVEKVGRTWSVPWPNADRQVKILQPWAVWPGAVRDDSTEYTIKAGVHPGSDPRMKIEDMVLNDDTSDIEFPKVQKPMVMRPKGCPTGFYEFDQKVQYGKYATSGNRFVVYPSSGTIKVYVYTKYVKPDMQIKVSAEEKAFFGGYDSSTTISARGEEFQYGWTKMTVDLRLKAPPADDYYRLKLVYEILDKNNKPIVSTDNYIDVAYQSFINKEQA